MTRHLSAPPGVPSAPASAPHRLRPSRRTVAAGGLLLPLGLLAACSDPVPAATGAAADSDSGTGSAASDGGGAPAIDTSGTQEPIRAEADEEVAALLPAEIAESGVLRVGINGTSSAPLSFLADDNQTYIGSEIDIARIVADKLGLEFELKLTTWENWPLSSRPGSSTWSTRTSASTPSGCRSSTSPPTAPRSCPSS